MSRKKRKQASSDALSENFFYLKEGAKQVYIADQSEVIQGLFPFTTMELEQLLKSWLACKLSSLPDFVFAKTRARLSFPNR